MLTPTTTPPAPLTENAFVVEIPAAVMHRGVQAYEAGGQLVVDAVLQKGLPFHKDMNDLLPGGGGGEGLERRRVLPGGEVGEEGDSCPSTRT